MMQSSTNLLECLVIDFHVPITWAFNNSKRLIELNAMASFLKNELRSRENRGQKTQLENNTRNFKFAKYMSSQTCFERTRMPVYEI